LRAFGRGRFDGDDIGMRVRRTQDRGVERAGVNAEIVDEAAASRSAARNLRRAESTARPTASQNLGSLLWLANAWLAASAIRKILPRILHASGEVI
jgi:hypothetical protein